VGGAGGGGCGVGLGHRGGEGGGGGGSFKEEEEKNRTTPTWLLCPGIGNGFDLVSSFGVPEPNAACLRTIRFDTIFAAAATAALVVRVALHRGSSTTLAGLKTAAR